VSITTKTGDGGVTGLLDGSRVFKDDPRVEYLGALDELDAFLSDAQAAGPALRAAEIIGLVRQELSAALMPAAASGDAVLPFTARLENWIAELEAQSPRPGGFVRDWNAPAAVKLNIARAVCRRVERRAVTLGRPAENSADMDGAVIPYLNRLSDLLFLLALRENRNPA
jgi:cob(I)alamin adenosyltransferase